MILFSSALELELNNVNIMNNLIIDAATDKIFLSVIIDKNIYTCSHENSKSNFEKLIILITDFLNKNKTSINEIDKIYVNRGPGSFAGIRNSLSIVKGFVLTQKNRLLLFQFS